MAKQRRAFTPFGFFLLILAVAIIVAAFCGVWWWVDRSDHHRPQPHPATDAPSGQVEQMGNADTPCRGVIGYIAPGPLDSYSAEEAGLAIKFAGYEPLTRAEFVVSDACVQWAFARYGHRTVYLDEVARVGPHDKIVVGWAGKK